jgi:hypothetical protein
VDDNDAPDDTFAGNPGEWWAEAVERSQDLGRWAALSAPDWGTELDSIDPAGWLYYEELANEAYYAAERER